MIRPAVTHEPHSLGTFIAPCRHWADRGIPRHLITSQQIAVRRTGKHQNNNKVPRRLRREPRWAEQRGGGQRSRGRVVLRLVPHLRRARRAGGCVGVCVCVCATCACVDVCLCACVYTYDYISIDKRSPICPLRKRDHCTMYAKVQISQGLGPFLQIELLKTGRKGR